MRNEGTSELREFTDSEKRLFEKALGDDMFVYRDCLEATPLDQEEPTFQIAVAKRGNEYRAVLYELDENADVMWSVESDWSPNPFVTVDAIEEFKARYGY